MQRGTLTILFLFVTILSCINLPAQSKYEEKNFTRYTVKDGLSDNSITCLRQDDEGYMWIGTDAGLNRFDGNRFKKFYTGNGPLNLLSGSIWRLKAFGQDELGIITKGGFQVLNTKKYTVRDYKVADSTPMSAYMNAAWDATELPGQSFGVTSAAGFYVFSYEGKLLFRYDGYTQKDIGKARILYGRDILRLTEKKYIIYVNENRTAVYDVEKKDFHEMTPEDERENDLSNTPVKQNQYWSAKFQLGTGEFLFIRGHLDKAVYYNHALRKTVESPLWKGITDSVSWESKLIKLNDSLLALNSGVSGFHLLRINRKTGVITSDGVKYLRNYKIICLFNDKDNRIWAGTTEGLFKQELEPSVLNALHYPSPGGLKFAQGFSTVYRYKDKIYAARYAFSKGLVIIDAGSMKILKEIDIFSGNSNWNEIRSIEMYHPDTLWMGSNGGLLWFDTKTEKYGKVLDEKKYPWGKSFFAVLAPPRADGDAWMCSIMSGKVVRYNIRTRTFTLFTSETTPALPFEKVKYIVYDSFGDVWISGHALARWNNRKEVFDTLITVYGGENKYNDDIISIRADDNGSLWMHNVYNGLLEYKIKEKRFVAYSMKDGLPSDVLTGLSPVINNKLWLSGNSQLCLFDIPTRQFTLYDYRDGLPEHKPTAKRIYYDSLQGFLYLCCNEYLVRFPPTPPGVTDRSSRLLIEELNVNNEITYNNPENKISIGHSRNNLVINCSVIDFDKGNYQFAWRLNKAENWNAIGSQRSITLPNLPPGEYMLEVKASGKPGVEKTRTLSFTIQPPFWKKLWFIAAAVLLLGGSIYIVYRRRIRQIRQRANIDQMLSQAEMKALQAQMNPHFIFNSLNSIREMILNNENKDASHYLSKFAHLIRITLDQSSHSMVSLRNTADYLQRYMEMEQIRNGLFTWEVNMDKDLDKDEVFVPPMLIQPFIENALWHGVSAGNKMIHIKIDFKKTGESLLCTIDDNGMGIHQALQNKPGSGNRHRPHGIDNIKDRLKLLNEKYRIGGHISIEDKKDIPGCAETGTRVTVYLPLEIQEL